MGASQSPEVVVITGASGGVGRATVQAFAKRGAHIGLLARGQAGLEAAKREVELLGGHVEQRTGGGWSSLLRSQS